MKRMQNAGVIIKVNKTPKIASAGEKIYSRTVISNPTNVKNLNIFNVFLFIISSHIVLFPLHSRFLSNYLYFAAQKYITLQA